MQQGHHWNGNGLPWPMRENLQGRSGSLHSQRPGSGIDFTETRPYQPGDELRHMNWRAFARTGRLQVRVFQEDLAPTSCFVIDRRDSMRFGTRRRLKATQAARLAIFLATWEARSGAELGGLLLDEAPHWQPPASGEGGIHHLARLASKPCPPIPDLPPLEIKKTLSLLAQQLPSGSHLYLLSDFYDLDESALSQLYQLGKQHRVWAIGIHDPAEKILPAAGHLQLVWGKAGSNRSTAVNTQHARLQQQHLRRFMQRQQSLKDLCERADITYTSISADADNLALALQSAAT